MILILAGAGASAATNHTTYPTTVEFFERLPREVTGVPLFKTIKPFFAQQAPDVPPDIERLLWSLDELNAIAKNVGDQSNLPGWLLTAGRTQKLLKGNFQIDHGLHVMRELGNQAAVLASRVNKQIFAFYHRPPATEDLERAWIPLLKGLWTLSHHIEVFTTNYDVVIEHAIDHVRLPIDTGRRGAVQLTLQTTLWEQIAEKRETRGGMLTKLHGSVDWSWGEDVIHAGDPTFHGEHERHVIIYPGVKNSALTRPFDLFHNYFRVRAQQADLIIVIGYAFRDSTINDVIADRLQPRVPLLVIDPKPDLIGAPLAEQRLEHIRRGFDQEAVNAIMGFAEKAVGRTDGMSQG